MAALSHNNKSFFELLHRTLIPSLLNTEPSLPYAGPEVPLHQSHPLPVHRSRPGPSCRSPKTSSRDSRSGNAESRGNPPTCHGDRWPVDKNNEKESQLLISL